MKINYYLYILFLLTHSTVIAKEKNEEDVIKEDSNENCVIDNDKVELVDEIVSKIGDKYLLLSEIESGLIEYQTNNINITREDLIKKYNQQFKLIDLSKRIKPNENTINDILNKHMKKILKSINNDVSIIKKMTNQNYHEYKENIKKTITEQYKIQQFINDLFKNIDFSFQDVKKYYEYLEQTNNLFDIQDSYQVYQIVFEPKVNNEVITTLENIINEINSVDDDKKSEKFNDLIEKYSDKGYDGGELGYTKIGTLKDQEYEKIALSLQPNEISSIVKTKYGYNIIQLLDIKDDEFNSRYIKLPIFQNDINDSLKEVNDIVNKLRKKEISWIDTYKKHCVKWAKYDGGLMTDGYLNVASLDDLNNSDNKDIIDIITNMKPGDISDAHEIIHDGNKYLRILFLKKIIKKHKINLKDDYQCVKDLLIADYKKYKLKELNIE